MTLQKTRKPARAASTTSADLLAATKPRDLPASQRQRNTGKTSDSKKAQPQVRNTVSLDAAIVRLLDYQAEAELTTRAALTRKALKVYVAAANREPFDVVVVSGGAQSAPLPDLDAPAPRVTIQLSKDAAEAADTQARREETTRGALARKAIRFYINRASGHPVDQLQVVTLLDSEETASKGPRRD